MKRLHSVTTALSLLALLVAAQGLFALSAAARHKHAPATASKASHHSAKAAPVSGKKVKPAGKGSTAVSRKAARKHRAARPYVAPVKISAAFRATAMHNVEQALATPNDPPIEQPEALAPFFAQLSALQDDPSSSLHILHFGDSHTAADMFTGELRSQLQQKFGNGGAGFSFPGYPFAGCRIQGTRRSQSAGWTTEGTHFRDIPSPLLGLGGIAIVTSRPGESVTLEAESDSADLYFLQQPGGGRLSLSVDGGPAEVISTDAPLAAAGTYTVQTTPGTHRFELRTMDAAPVRLLGWATQNRSGITYEAAGINGAEASLILRWDETLQAAYLQRRSPALVVLAYGTNEAGNSNWNYDAYRAMLSTLIGRIRHAVPNVAILVIGPSDRYTKSRRRTWAPFTPIDHIVAAQRDICRELGCAYWDQRERMGGAGAMKDWVSVSWAQPDHTHFTGPGYQALARALYADLMQQYELYRRAAK